LQREDDKERKWSTIRSGRIRGKIRYRIEGRRLSWSWSISRDFPCVFPFGRIDFSTESLVSRSYASRFVFILVVVAVVACCCHCHLGRCVARVTNVKVNRRLGYTGSRRSVMNGERVNAVGSDRAYN